MPPLLCQRAGECSGEVQAQQQQKKAIERAGGGRDACCAVVSLNFVSSFSIFSFTAADLPAAASPALLSNTSRMVIVLLLLKPLLFLSGPPQCRRAVERVLRAPARVPRHIFAIL